MNVETKILELSKKRYEFFDNEEGDDINIDILATEILKLLNEHRDELSFELIVDELTKLGQCPCLLYDDNGNFAMSGDGISEICEEPDDTSVVCFVKKEQWKPTIREALYYYLDN